MAKSKGLYPKEPKAQRVKLEQETAKRTRVQTLTNDLKAWALQEGQYNLRHFTKQHGMKVSQLKALAEESPELKQALEFAREMIGSNLSDEWHKNPLQEKFARSHMEFYDDEWKEYMAGVRAQVTAKTTGAVGIIRIESDKMGIVAENKE